jgi:drug/metabolite transporter (DMT)-like permease
MRADGRGIYSSRAGVITLATLCCLLWGSAYPAIKVGYALLVIAPADVASQILFAGWRFVLAGGALLLFALAVRRPVFALSRLQVRQIVLLGVVQTAVQYVFFYIGLAHASGVKSSIMNATGVFFSVALAHIIYSDDRLTARKTIGCMVGFVGVIVVNLRSGAGSESDFTLLGEGFIVVAAFVLAAGSIYGKKLSRAIDPMVMTGWQLLVGGGLLTIVGQSFGGSVTGLGTTSGALLIYMALLSAVAFAVWSMLLKHNPVGRVAAFNFLVPVFGAGLSAVFLGEALLRWSNLAALVLVAAGIWLVTRSAAET